MSSKDKKWAEGYLVKDIEEYINKYQQLKDKLKEETLTQSDFEKSFDEFCDFLEATKNTNFKNEDN